MPDEWTVAHSDRYSQAQFKLQEQEPQRRGQWQNVVLSLALLENWHIPGITGPPDKWDVGKLPLKLSVWFTSTTLFSFNACFNVPKASSLPSSNGEMVRDGELETTA